ncbi:MAG: biosynthetic-type acetolactate synthase large subunit [Clostridiales bacterium]|jgi:acetolactate synthase-1/2/3 large subunit|nr:biosynthetic-type acetolactate synthase large subunit [Clostridiales bacterium]
MVLSGAQILIEELVRHGTNTVFGYPGGQVIDIYDELYRNAHRIGHILTAHEQGAAHAADGYARVTGRPGVVFATSGPGATNLVTGIANAYLDSVPMIAVTGNVTVNLLGKDSFQEVDIVGITQPVVKHNFIVRDVGELESVVTEAFAIATSGRPGPVLIDIPKSVQRGSCEYSGNLRPSARDSCGSFDITEALEAISKSKRPLIYCGGGVVSAGAEEEVLALSKKISAPVTLSMMGLSAVPHSYELNLGMCGMHGRAPSTLMQSRADLIIAVGVRFSDRATGDVSAYASNSKIIHIDIDEAELGKNVPNIIEVCGSAKSVLAALLESTEEKRNEEWRREVLESKEKDAACSDGDRFSPRAIIRCINGYFGGETVVATDVGQHQMWVMQNYAFEKPRTLLTSGGLGTMGFGLGAAIGGCIASGRKRTVLFTGDGSFGMNLNEMATAVMQRTPILIVILNNGVLGMVRQWQNMFYEGRYSSTTLGRKTDFVALARAFGADGCRVDSMAALKDAMERGFPEDSPFVLDCRIARDEMVFPMIPPGGSVRDIRLS